MTKNNKTVAFTLAETLLTLAIIGVVAALTIPSMKEFADESRYVSLAKKSFNTSANATAALEAKYGDVQFWSWSDPSALNNRYKEVMNALPNVVQAYPIKVLDGTAWSLVNNNWFQTTDGMAWYVYNYSNTNGSLGVIHVDTNGAEGPNKVGVDVLGFVVTKDGVFPLNDRVHDNNSSWACVNYMIKYGKMPWLNDSSYASCQDGRIQK